MSDHAFPHDFRSGPSPTDWDPSKWFILALHQLRLVSGLRRAKDSDLKEAIKYMRLKTHFADLVKEEEPDHWMGDVWNEAQLFTYIQAVPGKCVMEIDGFVIDATNYLGEHPGGPRLLRKYSISLNSAGKTLDASWAFAGGLNNHSRAAKGQMRSLRVAKMLRDSEQIYHGSRISTNNQDI
ncbi:hypothetical protein H2248_001181 [Termitomyces sp. 'cryptogamus']|nr:hypothetical protein H2248_001181 [Termitomyces sp. 'cryptogamus']